MPASHRQHHGKLDVEPGCSSRSAAATGFPPQGAPEPISSGAVLRLPVRPGGSSTRADCFCPGDFGGAAMDGAA